MFPGLGENIFQEVSPLVSEVVSGATKVAGEYIKSREAGKVPVPVASSLQQASILPAKIFGIPVMYLILGGVGLVIFKLLRR